MLNPIALAEKKLNTPAAHSAGLLVLRVAIGVVFMMHGWQKFFVYGLPGVAENFGKMGIPMPMINAVLASTAEFVGGILLIIGLGTRFAAIPLAITMLVAWLTAHFGKGFFLPAGFEYVFTLGLGSVALFLLGAGNWSADAALSRK